jgi:dolichol-phosphate mannosyltransferase
MKEISVIVPVFNEEGNLANLYKRINDVLMKINKKSSVIFIDDGSNDNSTKIILELHKQNNNIEYILFTRNFGHQSAVFAGLIKSNSKCVVIIDADLQDPPELISEMYSEWLINETPIIYAQRIKRKGESIFKKITAKFYYRFFSSIIDFNIPLDTGDFRLIDKKVVNEVLKMKDSNLFLRGQISWTGYRSKKIEYVRQKRKSGKTGYSLKKMIRFGLDGIISFSNYPLKLISLIGFYLTVISLLLILYALSSKFYYGNVIDGWTSLTIIISFFGGIQLIAIGIFGQYLARINDNVLSRSHYIISRQSK